jgi:hypothetical protein
MAIEYHEISLQELLQPKEQAVQEALKAFGDFCESILERQKERTAIL